MKTLANQNILLVRKQNIEPARKQNIQLTRKVRFAKLTQPFFPKTYARIMENKARERIIAPCASHVSDADLSPILLNMAVEKMAKVQTKPNVGEEGVNIRSVGIAATLFDAALITIWSAEFNLKNFQSETEALGIAVYVLLASALTATAAWALRELHLMKNDERSRIGAELATAIEFTSEE